MTVYVAKDGHKFSGQGAYQRGRLYDKSLGGDKNKFEAINTAPGGPRHEHEMKQHGIPAKIILEPKASRATIIHPDGHKWTEVHPDPARLHQAARDYIGLPEFPASEHHQRTRSHPIGTGEADRLRKEEGRVEEAAD